MSHLNGQKMYSKIIRVAMSKHQTVQLPRDGLDDQGLTKDFTNSPLQSFQKARLQELPEHFPSFCHAASVKHPVSKKLYSALVNLCVSRRGAKSFFCHVLKARHI